jgi:hypothetical protein
MEKEQIQSLLNEFVINNCSECRAPKTEVYPGGCPRQLNRFGQLPKCFYSVGNQRSELYRTLIEKKTKGEITMEDLTQIEEYINTNDPRH